MAPAAGEGEQGDWRPPKVAEGSWVGEGEGVGVAGHHLKQTKT